MPTYLKLAMEQMIDFETVAGPSALGTGSGTDHHDASAGVLLYCYHSQCTTGGKVSLILCAGTKDGDENGRVVRNHAVMTDRDAIEGNISRCTTRRWPICSHQRI